jgi:aryl carrier-like protein
MARIGVATMPTQQAIEFLRAVQFRNRPQVGALRVRWSRWLNAMGFAAAPSKILDVYVEDNNDSGCDQSAGELRQSLLMASPEDRLELVSDYLGGVVARVLGTSAENLDRQQPLQRLGLDSLTTVELCNRLENDLRITVPLSALAKQPTLTQLSEVLLGLLPQRESRTAATP